LSEKNVWNSHAVRIFVVDADPKLIKHFIKEVRSKKTRQSIRKRERARKKSPRTTKRVA
jgi:hypothetical protein